MGCFNWGYPYSQMLHNIKSCNLTTKIDKRERISKNTDVMCQAIIMRNIMKFHAWAEPYVNFLLGGTPPLKKQMFYPKTKN